jgi:hypothetical protein
MLTKMVRTGERLGAARFKGMDVDSRCERCEPERRANGWQFHECFWASFMVMPLLPLHTPLNYYLNNSVD